MKLLWIILLFLVPFAVVGGTVKEHRDYVPDKKTAERIAEVILVGQYWIVQGHIHQDGIPNKGGGFAVWINKHSGCIGKVVEHMK